MNRHSAIVQLGDLMLERGGSTDPSKHSGTSFALYSIPAFDAGAPEFQLGAAIGSTKKNVRPGDVLVSRIVPHIRRAWVVEEHDEPIIASGEWIVFRDRRIYPNYLRHFLISDPFHKQFMMTVAGVGGSLLRARPADVARIDIHLPPLDEQRRIAAILDKADDLRQKRKRAIALLDSLTQSIFLEMFGDTIANPRQLPTASLEDLVSSTRKITYGILMPGEDQTNGVPYVRVTDIQGGEVLVGQLRRTTAVIANDYRRSALKNGDLLISIRGHVGRMAIAPQACEGANITQDTARLALVGANPVYVMNALATDGAQHWMRQRTKGAAVRGINLGDLKRFPVPLPSAELQHRFAREAASIASLLVKSRAEMTLLEEQFAALQHRAFSGQL